MIAMLVGAALLLWRPSWVFLFAICAAFAVFGFLGAMSLGDPLLAAVAAFINGGLFFLVGGLVVAIRLWLRSRWTSRQDKEIDAELARIRGDAPGSESGADS